MPYVAFSTLKERVPIADAVQRLGLTLRQRHDQLRGPCPACRSGGDRALVVTPAKQAFYCFGGQTGGDVIALVAHVRGVSMKEAAAFLADGSGKGSGPEGREHSSPEERVKGASRDGRVLRPLTYLEAKHESVRRLGLDPETCAGFGAGYAPKGIMRARLAIPIHDAASGELVAYCGQAVSGEEPKMLFPRDFDPRSQVFNGHRIGEGETTLMRDPLEVMLACQNGIAGGIAFLTDSVSSAQLRMLAAMMDAKGIETIETA